MKKTKIFTAAAIICILLLVAVTGTFALTAPTISVSPAEAKPGDTVTFTISGPQPFTGTLTPSANLTLNNVQGATNSNWGQTNVIMTTSADSSITVTYTLSSDAKAGDTYSLGLSGAKVATADEEEDVTVSAASGKVAAAPAPSEEPQPSDQPQPSEEPQPSDQPQPSDEPVTPPVPSDSTISANTTNTKLDKVPKTADETPSIWMFSIIGIAAASVVTVMAVKKVRAK